MSAVRSRHRPPDPRKICINTDGLGSGGHLGPFAMALLDTVSAAAASSRALSPALRLAPVLFAATLFMSALLLFAVQRCSPRWCCPSSAARLRSGRSPWWRSGPSCSSATSMPICSRARWRPRGAASFTWASSRWLRRCCRWASLTDDVMLWLVGLFATSIGLPFIALPATAPLLQSWFAASGHPQSHNPYVLYNSTTRPTPSSRTTAPTPTSW